MRIYHLSYSDTGKAGTLSYLSQNNFLKNDNTHIYLLFYNNKLRHFSIGLNNNYLDNFYSNKTSVNYIFQKFINYCNKILSINYLA